MPSRAALRRTLWMGLLLLPLAGGHAAERAAPGAPRSLAITIDDLPLSGMRWSGDDLETLRRLNRKILAALQEREVPAIGFVNESRLHVRGEMDERIAILREWLDAGMDLGNHTFSHPDLNSTPLREYLDDILHGEVITRRLLQAAGREMRFFRFPYNHRGTEAGTRAAVEEFLTERGYRIAPFTVEHSDYAFNVVYARARRSGDRELMGRVRKAYLDHLGRKIDYFERLSRDLLGREIPQVLLIHVNEINADCLGDMLLLLEERGYAFVPLEEALEDPAYHARDEYLGRWGPSWLHRWHVSRGHPMRRDEPDPPAFLLEAYREATGG